MKNIIVYALVILILVLQLAGCGSKQIQKQITGTDLFVDFAKTTSIEIWLNDQESVVSEDSEIQEGLDILKKSDFQERETETDLDGGWTYSIDFITEEGKQHITVRGEHTLDVNGSWYYMNESDYDTFVKWVEAQ